VNTISAGPLGS
nr:NADH-enoyl ACP reductase [Brassica napus, Peptide Partial, 11 aa] [Brassica napus]